MNKTSGGFWRQFSRVIPETEAGDYLFSFLKFIRVHKRLPNRSMTFNDALFRAKTAPEILNPLRVFLTDKEFFKIFVSAVVGPQYVVPSIGILRSEEDIDNFIFPNSFCAKPTHMSGLVSIVDSGSVDLSELKSWLTMNHYPISRERNYRSLTPKVIVEPVIFGQKDITDFRIFCFEGKAKLICLDIGKYSDYRRAFYNVNWERQAYSIGYPIFEDDVPRPRNLEEMISVAERLSQWVDFVRVDFYTNGDQFYLGEITNCHASASQRFNPLSAESIASSSIFGNIAP
jgi:hypothetical protein